MADARLAASICARTSASLTHEEASITGASADVSVQRLELNYSDAVTVRLMLSQRRLFEHQVALYNELRERAHAQRERDGGYGGAETSAGAAVKEEAAPEAAVAPTRASVASASAPAPAPALPWAGASAHASAQMEVNVGAVAGPRGGIGTQAGIGVAPAIIERAAGAGATSDADATSDGDAETDTESGIQAAIQTVHAGPAPVARAQAGGRRHRTWSLQNDADLRHRH